MSDNAHTATESTFPPMASEPSQAADHLRLIGELNPDYRTILTPAALDFVARLAREFEPRRQALLARRRARQLELDRGVLPDFLPETRAVRESKWTVAPIPKDLLDRRV